MGSHVTFIYTALHMIQIVNVKLESKKKSVIVVKFMSYETSSIQFSVVSMQLNDCVSVLKL